MIEISGDILEGGGQILRNTSALSCILRKPVRINRIRAKRSKPGLRPQHLCGFQLLADMTRASVLGDQVNSTEVQIESGPRILGGSYIKEVGTAGSLVLLLQSSLPVALFADGPTTLTLGGGTNAEMAPPIDYFMEVFFPIASSMGIKLKCLLEKRGFYPKGGGKVVVEVEPVNHVTPITLLERGEVTQITGIAYVAGQLPIKVAKQMAVTAERILRSGVPSDTAINIEVCYESASKAVATGCGIFLKAKTTTNCLFGGTGFGRKGKPAEEVGKEAAEELLKGLREGGCVDEHLQDQLIIFMALASGQSSVRCGTISLHTETAMFIAKELTGVKFKVEADRGTNIISCDGISFTNTNSI